MNVLSIFDGMSCGQVALQRAGIHVDNYFAGWTVDVIAHIFSEMQSRGEIWHMARQSNLFSFVEA